MIAQNLRDSLRQLVLGQINWPLFIYGCAGTGKTCAALCLLDYCGGEYWTASSLCSALIESSQGRLFHQGEAGRDRYRVYPEQLWSTIRRSSLVVLDELGIRQVSDHHYESVKRVIDDRDGRPLITISNHGIAEIAQLYDDRVASRLAAGTIVQVLGRDQRLAP